MPPPSPIPLSNVLVPSVPARFALNVLFVTVSVVAADPVTSTAPPCPCEPATPGALPVNTSSASVRAAAWLAIAPPFGSSPPVSVSPLTVTLLAPELIARIPVVPGESIHQNASAGKGESRQLSREEGDAEREHEQQRGGGIDGDGRSCQQLLGCDQGRDDDHPAKAHHAEGEQRGHQRPAAAEAVAAMHDAVAQRLGQARATAFGVAA